MEAAFSRKRVFAVQAVVFLFVLQTVFGILACPSRSSFASNDLVGAFENSAICSHVSLPSDTPTPAKKTPDDCPFCLSFVCHGGAILTAEFVIPLSDTQAAFPLESIALISGPDLSVFHNRDPPLSFPT